MKLSTGCLAVLMPFALVWACGSTNETEDGSAAAASGTTNSSSGSGGTDNSGAGMGLELGGDSNVGTAGSTVGAGGTLVAELCGDSCVCDNGIDDDQDGLVDGLDPECTGPLDNDEGSFATGIPGDNRDPKWQDCFFDGNSGAGDDDCRYHTECITGDRPRTDPGCKLTDACIDFCGARTPNGCDCFGCCSVELADGSSIDILTGENCSLETANDAAACQPCRKSAECGNTCGTCELCPGKTVEDLPAECDTGSGGAGSGGAGSGGPGYTCDNGEQVCGPGLDACPLGRYCSLGCCLLTPPR
jgi:hypothetical protein